MKLKEKKEFFLFLLLMALFAILYKLVQIVAPGGVDVSIWLDDMIPFLNIFVVPYITYYFVFFIPAVYIYKNKKWFRPFAHSFLFVIVAGFLTQLLFQTTFTRPIIVQDSVLNSIIYFIYSVDKPLNLFPSFHVAITGLVNLALLDIDRRKGLYLLPLSILIIISTLLIKQHVILDIVGGLILAFAGYFLVFRKIKLEK